MIDDNGNFRFGNRARTRGDIEKEILKYCEKHSVTFDVAWKNMWQEKIFVSALGAPYDLSIEENRDIELKRALLYAVRFDAQSSDLKRKCRKELEVDNDKEIDSKRHDVEFSSALQLCTALETSIYRVYEYYKYGMSEKEKVNYLEQSKEVMIMAHMDAQRCEMNLPLVEARFSAYAAELIRPACGREVIYNKNGFQGVKYRKKLVKKYKELVRSYFSHNAYVVSKSVMIFIPSNLCYKYNFGMGCEHSENCSNESKWHVWLTHWCLKCGSQAIAYSKEKEKKHPYVACKHFRATWAPTVKDYNWENKKYDRPDMDKLIERRNNLRINSQRGRGGRGGPKGRGTRGRGRGYGRGKRFDYGGYDWDYHGDSNNSTPRGAPSGRGRGRGKPKEPKQEQQTE